jgi:hypothetical protein
MPTTDPYAVPPAVWEAIVPEARATDARESRVTAWVVIAAVLLVGASFLGTRAGAFGPRVDVESAGSESDVATHSGRITLEVHNTGRPATRITGAQITSLLGSTVRVTAVHLTPETLAGGDTGTLEIGYTMADCEAYRSSYGDVAGADLGTSDALQVDATTWWGGTRPIDLDDFGSLGDLISGGCLPG